MLETDIPTYAGGLGILAGDLLKSCADKQVKAVGISLVYSGSTFSQVINSDGTQNFKKIEFKKMDQLKKLQNTIILNLMGKRVTVGVWRYDIVGLGGFVVPVYLLDTDLHSNEDWARNITKNLYVGDGMTRIYQELLLGVGGVKMLRNLGYNEISNFHMNEGHAAFAPLELLVEDNYDLEKVKQKCVFTTHTPVPEGHDRFDYDFAYKYLGDFLPWNIKELATNDKLSMTDLAINCSNKAFAVSKKHKYVANKMFPQANIDYITNGVHAPSWIAPQKQVLYSEYLPNWVGDNSVFLKAPDLIPDDAFFAIHNDCKRELLEYVNERLTSVTGESEKTNPPADHLFDINTLTIAMARRPVSYKRPLLLYKDLERFLRIGVGKLQIIQCGKSHPQDEVSKEYVRKIIEISKRLKTVLKIVYLEDYSPKIARLLVAGSDIWLNTPRRPMEASGTSGMKAALNGVINFSVLDGWWIEAFEKNPEAGFSIGVLDPLESTSPSNDNEDSDSLYKRLEQEIIPLYYDHKTEWIKKMKKSITLGAYFNTSRCIDEYLEKAWRN
ncbi:alpha-glucan family phosphorylase [Patescibacteria group bacterium]|nr:alpha-glucan family phosphorylase [Patescibacteria group bacterium]